jgi:uncharacterized membrane protein required for colicin V production
VLFRSNLGAADRLAGAAFGFVQGIVVSQVVLIALIAFPEPDIRDDVDSSAVAKRLLEGRPLIVAILPRYFDDVIGAFLDGARELDGESGDPPNG